MRQTTKLKDSDITVKLGSECSNVSHFGIPITAAVVCLLSNSYRGSKGALWTRRSFLDIEKKILFWSLRGEESLRFPFYSISLYIAAIHRKDVKIYTSKSILNYFMLCERHPFWKRAIFKIRFQQLSQLNKIDPSSWGSDECRWHGIHSKRLTTSRRHMFWDGRTTDDGRCSSTRTSLRLQV